MSGAQSLAMPEQYSVDNTGPTTPLLTSRARVSFRTRTKVRSDYAVMAANDVVGLDVFEFKEMGVSTETVFNSDRVTLAQVQEFISELDKLRNTEDEILDNVCYIKSDVTVKSKAIGVEPPVRSKRVRGTLAIEMPSRGSYGTATIKDAFTFKELDPTIDQVRRIGSPDVVSQDDAYVLEASNNRATMMYSNGIKSKPFHVIASSELGLSDFDITYVTQVSSRSNINPFSN
ncbi:MAG: hypothetical protein J07AB43_02950 [Candidatus Nanosalina sp. J07AB43]|jgi:hypothetical protein|nr:MAG: hypothetical protein J07AB43_02950 [Candidatus Nanosalina sp. J07AB43]